MSELKSYQVVINGEWQTSQSGETFETCNPFSGLPWATLPRCNAEDVDLAVNAAWSAFHNPEWAELSATARGALLHRLGDLIAENADKLAEIEVRDNGKLYAEMRAQTGYLPQWYCY